MIPTEIADPASQGFDAARLARLRPWMQGYIDQGKFPGALTMIARRGVPVYCDWVGMRDVERALPWQRDTILRYYSMTKPITSTAFLMLYEDGLCHLDDPVDMYLPEFANPVMLRDGATDISQTEPVRTRLTVHHLLTHTSGLTYGFNEGILAEAMVAQGIDHGAKDANLADTVRKLASLPLQFDPGSRWNYGVSTDVLGRVIEVITGEPLDKVLTERILAPLGMHDTFFSLPDDKADRFASLYDCGPNNSMVLADPAADTVYRNVKQFSGGGGLLSTVDDYLRFAEMLRRGGALGDVRLLAPKTVEVMTSNALPGDLASMGRKVFAEVPFDGIGFGLGVAVMLDPARAMTLGTAGDYGWGGKASTVFWIDPRLELTVIFNTQLSPSSSYPNRKELRALVYSSLLDP